MMKKYYSLVTILFALLAMSFVAVDDTMTKEDGMLSSTPPPSAKMLRATQALPH